MEREQQEEFLALRDRADTILREAYALPRRCGLREVQLLVRPSFENWYSIDLRRNRSEPIAGWLTTWRMDVDQEAFRTPVERLKHPRNYRPTIEVADLEADAHRLEALVRQIRSIALPLGHSTDVIGFDGVSYELTVGGSYHNCRFHWWVALPDEWKALTAPVEELLRLANERNGRNGER